MKNLKSLMMVMVAALFLSACGGDSNTNASDATNPEDVAASAGQSYTVDPASSSVNWKGSTILKSHEGAVALKSGELKTENGMISAGSFVIDMTKITNSDLTPEDGQSDLIGHLSGADFFDSSTYPEAKFEITKVEKGADANTVNVSGNLTIKATTKNITFPAKVMAEGNKLTANAEFAVNRADFDVQYGSKSFFEDLVDEKVINDNIEFRVTLVASGQ